MTDEQVIKKVAKGNIGLSMILFKKYNGKVFSFYRYMGLSIEDAEDLTHEVFEKVIRSCGSFNLDKLFKPWLYQIMRSQLVDFRRVNGRTKYVNISEFDFKETVDFEYDEIELSKLNMALLELPNHDRELILLVKFQQLSYAEAATIFGISEGAVKTRVHRIIHKLTDYFKKQYPNERD